MNYVDYKTTCEINELLQANQDYCITGVLGQRYIGNALTQGDYEIHGYPGNGFASFLSGANIDLYGNAQEACGDTMSSGCLYIHGSCGDALAYGMRGGHVLVRDDCGARCGIHMKQYGEQDTLLVIGGRAKDFLGEYLCGGNILVLNKDFVDIPVGEYCGIGAHGGNIYVRMREQVEGFEAVSEETLEKIKHWITMYCEKFQMKEELFQTGQFYQKTPSKENPYEGLYITY